MKRILQKLLQTIIRPQEHSLKLQTIRAAFWGFMGKGSGELFRLIGNLILTRLLFPEAFGLMAMANTTLMMVNLFSDTGIKTAIIQNSRGNSPDFLNTAWIISLCRGLLLCFIMMCLAWPLSYFYNEPSLKTMLLLMALNPLIMGFENPSLSLFTKRLRIDKLVIFELTIQISGIISLIAIVSVFRSVTALAIGTTLTSLYRTIGSFIVTRPLPKFLWNRESGSEIFHFGKFIFLNTLVTWMARNADIILIGKLMNMEILGLYNIGKNLSYIVLAFCLQVLLQSYLPAVSSISNDPNRVMKVYKQTVSFTLAVGIPFSMVMMLFSKDIIFLLYDPRYQNAYIPMLWISLCGIFRLIGTITGTTFIALGKPRFETTSISSGLLISIMSIIAGIRLGGLHGAAIGVSLSFTLTALFESLFLYKMLKFDRRIVFIPWIQSIVTIISIGALYMLLRNWLYSEGIHNIPFIILFGIIGPLLSMGIYRFFNKRDHLQGNLSIDKGGFSSVVP